MPADNITTEAELEELLSQPTSALVSALGRLAGDILIVGVAGKMGPSLGRLAVRATTDAGVPRRIFGVSRFSRPGIRADLEEAGVETIVSDLFDRGAIEALPSAPNIIYMAGRKFGTTNDQAATWATNAYLPGAIAERFGQARIVAFSTGNVYPLSPAPGRGPAETDRTGPIGEYAEAALARERVLDFFSRRHQMPMALLRLNYAIEPRYGVLRDIADAVHAGKPIDLSMGYVNAIWQRDANAIALQALEHAAVPPFVLNVTGRPEHAVREIATEFGRMFNRTCRFAGVEAPTALLSDASRCEAMFGPAPVGMPEMIERVAVWVAAGGSSLDLPTHFGERDGRF